MQGLAKYRERYDDAYELVSYDRDNKTARGASSERREC
jgi:hypothetical protein